MQCAIPIFDGLLPEPHNACVLKLLFDLAHWHGLAKLRMHTDPTLDIFSCATTSLGNSLCTFEEKTCAASETRELECEQAAWQQRQEKSVTTVVSKSRRPTAANNNAPKKKKLNLSTYKNHALGDYVDTIRCIGTTDSYSTQPVSLYMMFCMALLTIMMVIRVSSSTGHLKLVHFGLAANQYHCKYRGLSHESAVSA
jgi:hypothetical protein